MQLAQLRPPTINTLPSGNSVAECPARAVVMLPVGVNGPAAGAGVGAGIGAGGVAVVFGSRAAFPPPPHAVNAASAMVARTIIVADAILHERLRCIRHLS